VGQVSVVAPDCGLIAEVTLYADGFTAAKVGASLRPPHAPHAAPLTTELTRGLPQELGRKAAGLMRALQQQLGGRARYDFGLRAFLAPVLRVAGARRWPAAPRASLPSMQGKGWSSG